MGKIRIPEYGCKKFQVMIKIGIAGFGKIGRIRFEEISKRNDCSLTGVFGIINQRTNNID